MKETPEQEKLKGEGGDITLSGEAGQQGMSKVNISLCGTLAPTLLYYYYFFNLCFLNLSHPPREQAFYLLI